MENASFLASCHTAKEIASDDGFMKLLIFRLVMFVIGLLMLVGMFVMESYVDGCDYLISAALSVVVRAPPDVAMYGQCWSMFFLALERSIATVYYRHYEKRTNVLMGRVMLVVQIALSLLWIFLLIFDFDWETRKVSCSLVNGKTESRFLILMSSMAALEIFTVLWLGVLYLANNVHLKMMKSELSRHKLTEKYQICENMRAIAHVFPIIVTHFVFFCATLVAQPINTYLHAHQSAYEFHVQIETLNFLPFYALVLPIVLFLRNRWDAIEGALGRVLVRLRLKNVDGEADDGQIYFQQLSQQFDKAASRSQPKRRAALGGFGLLFTQRVGQAG
uniref:G protein-coupled receptor n=1 Tax=Steinernema glaseri TaxID=37863 RepID=A0A1I7ZUZ6_9BILA